MMDEKGEEGMGSFKGDLSLNSAEVIVAAY